MSPSGSPAIGWSSVRLFVRVQLQACHACTRGAEEPDSPECGNKLLHEADAWLHPPSLTRCATSGADQCRGPGSTTVQTGQFPLLSHKAKSCLFVCVGLLCVRAHVLRYDIQNSRSVWVRPGPSGQIIAES